MDRLPKHFIPDTLSSLTAIADDIRADGGDWQARLAAHCGLGLNGHGARVAAISRVLAEGVDGVDVEMAIVAGHLHDIGKILVPNEILDYNGPLSESQRAIINQHPGHGHMILTSILDFTDVCHVLRATLWHHERWDGGGYPDGLAGVDIPVEARVASIADVVDALASPRSYKSGWEWDRIKSLLQKEAGGAFDPGLVSMAIDRMPDIISVRDEEIARQQPILSDEVPVCPVADDTEIAIVVSVSEEACSAVVPPTCSDLV